MTAGTVYIIGAGPGDPGLLTVRGRECLQTADVVVHDDRVSAAVLKYARSDAEVISVGTSVPEGTAQAAISYLLAEKAREGLDVARLKWGDPFVFDRGGEEALYLHEQRVRFEVVPGIPAGIAAPAYAGIPVTYPGGGDTLTFVRGFEDENRALPNVSWSALGRLNGTVVCYVGAHQLTWIFDELTTHGWSPLAGAALIYEATTAQQETIEGTLSELSEYVQQHPRRGPAMLVIGRVVGFREHLRWFDDRPLLGVRVLVTRPREQARELVEQLTRLGAEPVEAPLIRITPPADLGPLRAAVEEAGSFDWIVFSSINAVESFMGVFLDAHRDVRALHGPKLCAVGTSTAERLGRYGIRVDLVPEEFHAEAVVEALRDEGTLQGARVLLPHADIAREVIADGLRSSGAEVTEVVAYRTVVDESLRDGSGADIYRMLLDHRLDVVSFTSPSAVRAFATVFGEDQAADLLTHTVVASIGPVTSQAVRRLGVDVSVQAPVHTAAGLAASLAIYFERHRRVEAT